MHRRLILTAVLATVLGAAITVAATLSGSGAQASSAAAQYEAWYLDQTDTRPGYGGLLHIHSGPDFISGRNRTADTIDLGGQVSDFCRDRTGANPVRPHMLAFNGGDVLGVDKGRFAIIAWVVSGHVSIHDARTREIIECLRTTPGSGGARQAHAAWPTSDERHLIVANQNGKLVQRIRTDYANRRFAFEPAATLSLYEGTTPNGVPIQAPGIRPDNAPICIRPVLYRGKHSFVSLRGGGALVIDHTATPMRILAEWDKAHVDDNGCGQIESRGKFFFNAGATGLPTDRDGHTVYAVTLEDLSESPLPPNTPRPRVVYNRTGEVDAHGFALVRGGKHVLAVDRQLNDLTVFDTETETVAGRIALEGPLSSDPAPDLASPAPDGDHVFVTLRGPTPLSGGHPATGNTPGIGLIRLDRSGGTGGSFVALAAARRSDDRPPDPHGIGVRVNRAPSPSRLSLSASGRSTRLAAVRRRGIPVAVTTDRAATIRVTVRVRPALARALKIPQILGVATRRVGRADDVEIRVPLTKTARARLSGRSPRFNATASVLATPADGGGRAPARTTVRITR
ncbi:MAG: hypothetical protein Q8O56_05205 [Solirubrobacteraceae bacterium]|nr:hypothetical protein [Solirubrobacteraceae bacterium]